ncbi:caspase family protein [Frankia sp. CNm7]|uniref:Caspase family protein n=1 Tax=Frankia nepalensis TaxID=1836974 RepID=A0A937RGJ4_9ACTN|nr:AAA family ATPase [Frankia nepalensis]MBL7500891.1 caspase family protein [Frankia nepalensis]MBL7509257.1 caspase family protein [Frankia nepalensis]MBL7517284.1 caspase family protein [Frankia nepalensis]MBL7626979.1 caspase family protein [Frankia nepalensis]
MTAVTDPASPWTPGAAAFWPPGGGDLSGSGCRILLVGSGRYDPGSVFPTVESVATTLEDLHECLVQACGVPVGNIRVLEDAPNPGEFARALGDLVQEGGHTLVLYYVGHGAVDAEKNFYLTTRASIDLNRGLQPIYQALPYEQVQQMLSFSAAERIVVVLDCCYSGEATASMVAGTDKVFALGGGRDTYLLTAAARTALAPPGERHTAFSGELIRLLQSGDPSGPADLDLGHVYRHLARALPAAGRPEPQGHAGNRGAGIVLARNRAYRPPATRSSEYTTHAPETSADPLPGRGQAACPYPGLSAFGAEDARNFFGRDALLQMLAKQIVARTEDPRPLLVLGPSGAGKSSLLRAGLAGILQRGIPNVPRAWRWEVRLLTPGARVSARSRADPVGALAFLLANLLRTETGAVRARLTTDPDGLVQEVGEAMTNGVSPTTSTRLILVVDQFEELFEPDVLDADRATFTGMITLLAERSAAVVVAAVRTDYFERCAALPALRSALEGDLLLVRPMSRDELCEAIERPAARAGLSPDRDLVDLLLRDIQVFHRTDVHEAGVLPLLAHALRSTWQRSSDGRMTVAGYAETGGVARAVARSADEVYLGLDEAGRAVTRRLFLGLVRLSPDGRETTRRQRERAALFEELGGADSGQAVLEAFAGAGARLVTVGADGDTVELTHEALIRAWPRLRGWIQADRERLRTLQQITDAAATWDQEGRDPGGLYRGGRLALVLADYPASRRTGLGSVAREFLAESERVNRRRIRARRAALCVTVLLLVLAVAGTGIATTQWRTVAGQRADLQRLSRTASAQWLVAQAELLADGDPRAALRLGLAAESIAPSARNQSALLTMILNAPPDLNPGGRLDSPSRTVLPPNVTASPDGRFLAAFVTGVLKLWSFAGPGPVWTRPADDTGTTSIVAFDPNGTMMATGNSGTLAVFPVENGDPGRPVTAEGPGTEITAIALRGDGGTVAASRADGNVEIWLIDDQKDLSRVAVLTGMGGPVAGGVAFGANGQVMASADSNGAVHLWDATSPLRPGPLATFSPDGGVTAIGYSSADILAAASGDGRLSLWDVADPRRPRRLAVLRAHGGAVTSIAFSPDGTLLGLTGLDGPSTVWDVRDPFHPARRATLGDPASPKRSVFFGNNGTALIASGDLGSTMWDLSALREMMGRETEMACAAAGRGLTEDEWNHYVPEISFAVSCP